MLSKFSFALLTLFLASCAEEPPEALGESFEPIMIKFMSLPGSTLFYHPQYNGVENEVRWFQEFAAKGCDSECSVGVFTKNDEYTVGFITDFCGKKSFLLEGKITVILRAPKEVEFKGCGDVKVISIDQLSILKGHRIIHDLDEL
jgi:hypothetical protein